MKLLNTLVMFGLNSVLLATVDLSDLREMQQVTSINSVSNQLSVNPANTAQAIVRNNSASFSFDFPVEVNFTLGFLKKFERVSIHLLTSKNPDIVERSSSIMTHSCNEKKDNCIAKHEPGYEMNINKNEISSEGTKIVKIELVTSDINGVMFISDPVYVNIDAKSAKPYFGLHNCDDGYISASDLEGYDYCMGESFVKTSIYSSAESRLYSIRAVLQLPRMYQERISLKISNPIIGNNLKELYGYSDDCDEVGFGFYDCQFAPQTWDIKINPPYSTNFSFDLRNDGIVDKIVNFEVY